MCFAAAGSEGMTEGHSNKAGGLGGALSPPTGPGRSPGGGSRGRSPLEAIAFHTFSRALITSKLMNYLNEEN